MKEHSLDHQMLLLWLDLSSATKAYAEANDLVLSDIEPWKCESDAIQLIWQKITHPDHLGYLHDHLRCVQEQETNPRLKAILVRRAQAALDDCMLRCKTAQ
jgi:hypothetical protein